MQKSYEAIAGISAEKGNGYGEKGPVFNTEFIYSFKTEYERQMHLVSLKGSYLDSAIAWLSDKDGGAGVQDAMKMRELLISKKQELSSIQEKTRKELEEMKFVINALIPKAEQPETETPKAPPSVSKPAPVATQATAPDKEAKKEEADTKKLIASVKLPDGYKLTVEGGKIFLRGKGKARYFTIENPENTNKKDTKGLQKWVDSSKKKIETDVVKANDPDKSINAPEILASIQKIEGLKGVKQLSALGIKMNGDKYTLPEGLDWEDEDDEDDYGVELEDGYEVVDGKIVKETEESSSTEDSKNPEKTKLETNPDRYENAPQILESVKKIKGPGEKKGLEDINSLSEIGFEMGDGIHLPEGLVWVNKGDKDNFEVKLEVGYTTYNNKIVKIYSNEGHGHRK